MNASEFFKCLWNVTEHVVNFTSCLENVINDVMTPDQSEHSIFALSSVIGQFCSQSASPPAAV